MYDILVIGAGPGGYTAAIKASKLGKKVALVEKGELGGTCLNWGCIPTKAYYKNAELLKNIEKSDEFGIKVEGFSFDMKKAYERKNEVVKTLVSGIEKLVEAHKIDLFRGRASFIDKSTVRITGEENREIKAENIIIATGSKTFYPNIKGIDGSGILDSQSILELEQVPESLAIIGGGVIGIEFAGIFSAFGSKVQVIEFLPSILQVEDSEVVKRFTPLLKKQGVKVATSTRVEEIRKTGSGYKILARGKKGKEVDFDADKVLIATGRAANTDGLELEKIGIDLEKGCVLVDGNYKTNLPGIYAIGDVNGKTMLAHAASHQAIQVIEHIAGKLEKIEEHPVPSCTFVFPEISHVGITEDEAKEQGLEYRVNKFLFAANGKALAIGEKDGFVKVITDIENTIIGVHIMGPHASDLIHEGALAVSCKLSVDEIKKTIHAHPTLAEAFDEAVLGITKDAIHQI